MPLFGNMDGRPTVGPLIARLGLTGHLLGQIFLTPMAAFSLTYLLVFSASGGDFRLRIDIDMIPWIGMASLFYGMLALMLALMMGGFVPFRVIESGGWRLALGITRHRGSSLHRDAARRRYARSAHGRLSTLVHERFVTGHALWTTRGSLVLLAIPFQVMLATIPLTMVLLFPQGVVHQHRQLELALLLYCFCLYLAIRMFPAFARKYITIASLGRKLLGSTLRISWAFPVFLLWSMGQLSSYIVQRALGDNVALNISFEQHVFESLISAGATPETSFLNLLTALAVMPMAAFTTLAVLGGGSGAPPPWMKSSLKRGSYDDTQEQIDALTSSVAQLSAELQSGQRTPIQSQHTPAFVQQVIVPVNAQVESYPLPSALTNPKTIAPSPSPISPQTSVPPMNQTTTSLVDGLDFDDIIPADVKLPPHSQKSEVGFNDPIIRGFRLSEDEN